MGPFISIAAAVYGEDPIVEPLCFIPLHVHETNEAQLRAGERAIAALRVALHSLLERYTSDIVDGHGPRADFPFRGFYEDSEGNRHAITYDGDIDKKRVFRVFDSDGTPLRVKFSTRYSKEAHEFAHAAGFTPALLAVNEFYDWIMIVMGDVSAKYSSTMWNIKYRKAEKGKGKKEKGRRKESDSTAPLRARPAVSLEVAQQQVRTRLGVLHDGGFVHDDAPASRPDVLLVDWDWAGRTGQVVYPRGINTQLSRPEGALAYEEIEAEHDACMAEDLLQRL